MNKFGHCVSCHGWYPLHRLETVSMGTEFVIKDMKWATAEDITEKERYAITFFDERVTMCEECVARAESRG